MGIFSFRNKSEKEEEEKKSRLEIEEKLLKILDENAKEQGILETLSREIRQIGTDVRKHDMALEDCLDALEEQREEETQGQKRIKELEAGQEKLLQVLDAYQEQVWNMMRYAREHDPAWVPQIELVQNAVKGKQISGGIGMIEETGGKVDYGLHEVIETIDTAKEEQSQIVAEIYHPGYAYKGVVKKKAKVAAYRYIQTERQE